MLRGHQIYHKGLQCLNHFTLNVSLIMVTDGKESDTSQLLIVQSGLGMRFPKFISIFPVFVDKFQS